MVCVTSQVRFSRLPAVEDLECGHEWERLSREFTAGKSVKACMQRSGSRDMKLVALCHVAGFIEILVVLGVKTITMHYNPCSIVFVVRSHQSCEPSRLEALAHDCFGE